MSGFSTDEVALSDELSERIHEHVHSDTRNEVGGVLVGRLGDGVADVQVVLPALEAVGGAAQLTFTHDVWEEILSTVDREHPELQIVGWYHSHPGHGIFLSSYDQFIHENFFSAPGMVALVVDPQDEDAFGWFGWRDGSLTRLGSTLPVDLPDRTEVPREVAAAATAEEAEDERADRIRDAALLLLAVVLVFSIGSWAGRRPLHTQVDTLQERTDVAEGRTRDLGTALIQVCAGLEQLAGDGDVAAAQTEPPTPGGDAARAAHDICGRVRPAVEPRPAPEPSPTEPATTTPSPAGTPAATPQEDAP